MSDNTIPVYCPACERQNIESLFVKDVSTKAEGMVVRCIAQSHRFDYAKLMALNPRKVQLQLHEKQPGNTTTIGVWIYPEALAVLQQRFPANLNTTLCSFLTAVADPDTIVIEGEHARALRDSGVSKGRDIMGLAEVVKQLETEVAESRMQLKVLEPFLKMMGGAFGQQQQQTGQVAPLLQAGQLQAQQQQPQQQDYYEAEDPMAAFEQSGAGLPPAMLPPRRDDPAAQQWQQNAAPQQPVQPAQRWADPAAPIQGAPVRNVAPPIPRMTGQMQQLQPIQGLIQTSLDREPKFQGIPRPVPQVPR